MELTLKLTDAVAEDIRARVKSLDLGQIEKLRKAKDNNGTFDVIISTEDKDRGGDVIKQDGWELANYKNNPIVLWGHDYYSLPIGVCTETYLTEKNGVPALGARGVFLSADINPFAQQVRKLYEFGLKAGGGVGCTTSVGFIPKMFDEQQYNIIVKAELLEFSFVPVPANQGVGPAGGRALTFDEAKELGLDVEGMRVKGLDFVEAEKTVETEEKTAQAGDHCEMDDGSPGVLAVDPNDPDGALICVPTEEKATDKAPQKALMTALADEHDRHIGEIERAFDEFGEKEIGEDAVKDLRSALADEAAMHRAKAIECFKAFKPELEKTFNKKEHLKALREEHDNYETTSKKALDEFEEQVLKAIAADPRDEDEITRLFDGIAGKAEDLTRAHKKTVTKTAKAMCKMAFGEEDQVDEKMLAVLKDFLTPHIDPLILHALALKIGAKIGAETKKQIGEAHNHLNAAKAVLEALHPDLADGSGEESRSVEEPTSPAPATTRSRTRTSSPDDDAALKAHLLAREIVGGIEAVAREGLGKLKAERRDLSEK